MFYIAIAPVEVVAVLTYANNYIPGLLQGNTGLLSSWGLIAAVLLLGVMFLLNFLGIRRVAMVFSGLGWWKLAIPVLTIIVLVSQSYHPENLHILHWTSSFHGMFVAVASSNGYNRNHATDRSILCVHSRVVRLHQLPHDFPM